MRNLRLRLYFEPHDLWIGCFWERSPVRLRSGRQTWLWEVYLIAIPMLVLRLSWNGGRR